MYLRCLLLVALLSTTAMAGPRPQSPWNSALSHTSERPHHSILPASLDEDSLHRYNTLKLEPHLTVDFNTNEISGFMMMELVADELPLNRVDLRFQGSLTMDSVWNTSLVHSADFTRDGTDSLQLLFTPALSLAETIRVGIAYHGVPTQIDAWGGFHWDPGFDPWRPRVAYTMGEGFSSDPPPVNYNWLPSYADPTDKVLYEAWYRVSTDRKVASVGMIIDTVNHGDGTTTWHYRLDQPSSTYQLAVSVTNYDIQVQRESGPRIENFVYPGFMGVAQVHFSNVPAVLDSFAALFGPYPFDRFGNAMTPNGDMEHVTCVFHADFTVSADHTNDDLLIHELAHMWWGDWVTCGDWRDLWLNEGFATFCEAIGLAALHGPAAYTNHIVGDLYSRVLSSPENFPIYDPDYYWGQTVYEKGGCIMHMLRQIMGDEQFFQALREYGQEHAFGTAVTAEWQAKCEQHYGDLDWFFQPWVYGRRYPNYDAVLGLHDGTATLTINQIQTWNTLFRMPIDIRIVSWDGDTTEFTVWNDAVESQSWTLIPNDTLQINGWPRRMQIDPHYKILKNASTFVTAVGDPEPGLPLEFRVTSVYPNPFNAVTRIHFDLPRTAPVTLRVFDLLGRETMVRNLGTLAAGSHETVWDGAGAASGVYLFRIETPSQSRTAKAVLLK